MNRQRIQRWFSALGIGLLGVTSLSVFAQEEPEPEPVPKIQVSSRIAYVAPGTDAVTTDIFVLETLDQLGFIDHDNDPTTPRIIEGESYKVTNLTNTPGVNEIDPQFSWDGSLILYRGADLTNPGVNSLFVIDSDGENALQLTPDGVNVRNITFNPASTQVAFSATWGSNQIQIYRSDITGENQFLLTPGEGFHADFPLWRTTENGTEITYIRAEGGTSQVAVLDPLRATSRQVSNTPDQKFLLNGVNEEYFSYIQREDASHDWEIVLHNYSSGDTVQLTDNTTNDCCAVSSPAWSPDGIVGAGGGSESIRTGVYYLSDTEEGGRDIYWVNFDGSDRFNLTENDEREYTSVTPLFNNTLLVGYNEREEDETVPRLGIYFESADLLTGNYEFQVSYLMDGSDPTVLQEISLEQLEGLAAAGLLSTVCEMQTVSPGAEIYSEPRRDTEPVQVLIGDVNFVEVNAYLPGSPSSPEGWYHLTDGTWVPESHVSKPDDCPPLPRISPASVNL